MNIDDDTDVERWFSRLNDWAIKHDDFLCKKWVEKLITPPLFVMEMWAYPFMFSRFLFAGLRFDYRGLEFS